MNGFEKAGAASFCTRAMHGGGAGGQPAFGGGGGPKDPWEVSAVGKPFKNPLSRNTVLKSTL